MAKKQKSENKYNVNAALDDERFMLPLDGIRLDESNARKHDAASIDAIAASLSSFGQQKPIVLHGDVVIAGNGTVVAARQLGWTHIAVVTFADEASARAYAIADNRTAELSSWDTGALAASLEAINAAGQLDATGFSMDDMMRIVGEATAIVDVNAGSPVERPAVEPPPPGALAPGNTSHVRMVQLFLNDETHPVFMERVRALGVAYGKDNVTDVVAEAVLKAFEQVDNKKAAPVDNAE